MRTIVYVDGFNLYYGLLRRSRFKWLDLFALFQDHVLEAGTQVLEVRFYTAPVLGRLSDDPESPRRQRCYWQALRKYRPGMVTIIEGKLQASTPVLRLVKPLAVAPDVTHVQVYDLTEKKTDVNLAADLLCGAWTDAFEQAVLCSNDADLDHALACIRLHRPHLRVGLVAPVQGRDDRHIAADLKRHAHWAKLLSPAHLAAAQLPEKIPGTAIRRPAQW